MKEATIIIKRKLQYADAAMKFRILLDGNEIGEVGDGKEVTFKIPPGTHMIEVRDKLWCKSQPLKFTIKENETLRFICGSNMAVWKLFFNNLYSTIWSYKCLYIQLAE